MPLHRYGVLVGRAVGRKPGTAKDPHYHVHLVDGHSDYRIAVNVFSREKPSEVEYLILSDFLHPVIEKVKNLGNGYHPLVSQPGSGALDFIRGNLFDPKMMRPLPFDVPGPDNDLNEMIDFWIVKAIADPHARIFAFGEAWGEEPQNDGVFGFKPGQGIHDIHMNQGNVPAYQKDDGIWQDGGMFLHLPDGNRWVALFLKFQSQTWHTDDENGHPLKGNKEDTPVHDDIIVTPPWKNNETPTDENPDGLIRIVAALVNARRFPEEEWVTLLNTSPDEVNIDNYALLDSQENRTVLSGVLGAGQCMRVKVKAPMALSNRGGIITLVDAAGRRVDGVSYTKDQARHEGWTVVF